MFTSRKNRSIAVATYLLALSIGSLHAQPGQQVHASPQTVVSPNAAAAQVDAALSLTSEASAAQNVSASTSGTGQSAPQGTAGKQSANPAVVYMMVPVDIASPGSPMKSGCWVKLYDAQNYGGESLTLVGPTTINDMSGPFGINWDDRVESVQTGPQALLTVFDDEEFEERVAQFKPGQQVADVSKRLGLFDEFGSIKLECQSK